MRNGVIILTIGLIFHLFFAQISLAENSDVLEKLPVEKINPGSQYYTFKRAWEKIQETLTFSRTKKIKYYEKILQRRVAELDYITQKQLLSEVEKSSQRFIVFSAKLTESVSTKGPSEDKQKIADELVLYRKYLLVFRDRFPQDSSYWRLVQYDIDTVDGLVPSLR